MEGIVKRRQQLLQYPRSGEQQHLSAGTQRRRENHRGRRDGKRRLYRHGDQFRDCGGDGPAHGGLNLGQRQGGRHSDGRRDPHGCDGELAVAGIPERRRLHRHRRGDGRRLSCDAGRPELLY
ncbi:hypothetical protein SDC9_198872 [bioreactor metagenome]|uniref:Uncharacterized protein n=1 Tax=bioreactor metagenome TaxID=1076179 RepID=A0A645IJC0_9ZZZZ